VVAMLMGMDGAAASCNSEYKLCVMAAGGLVVAMLMSMDGAAASCNSEYKLCVMDVQHAEIPSGNPFFNNVSNARTSEAKYYLQRIPTVEHQLHTGTQSANSESLNRDEGEDMRRSLAGKDDGFHEPTH